MEVKSVESKPCAGWDRSLITKYDTNGPRYTSYPTALQFTESRNLPNILKDSTLAAHSIEPLSLYLHIPFCRNICYYCACNKVVSKNKGDSRRYLDSLCKEIKLRSELVGKHRVVTQLHLGGGTPTFLDNAELTELVHALSMNFKLTDVESREYAIEIDPRTVQDDSLALLKGLGFNRLSFGVQDFDPRVQKAINRQQNLRQIESLTHAARSYRYKSISYDLIYGLPLQTPESLAITLDTVTDLSPDRIAFYNYAHLPERFKSQRAIDRYDLPSAEEKLDMLELISSKLLGAGYIYIGMDHFAKASDELVLAQKNGRLQRNFQGYSSCMAEELIGMGVSAISSLRGAYAQNEKDLESYYERIQTGEIPLAKTCILNAEDEMRRYIIRQIICNLTLDTREIAYKFRVDFATHFANIQPDLVEMVNDGLLEKTDNGFRVTELGRPLLRNICMLFDEYLIDSVRRKLSKTI